MSASYRKGYMGEYTLVHELSKLGFMVVRTPRSGRIGLASPDVIAAKSGRLIVIECKSRKEGFKVPQDQLNQLKEWEAKAGAKPYVAWKMTRKGWFFLNVDDVISNNGNVGKKFVAEKSVGIEMI